MLERSKSVCASDNEATEIGLQFDTFAGRGSFETSASPIGVQVNFYNIKIIYLQRPTIHFIERHYIILALTFTYNQQIYSNMALVEYS
jgi:hypothetical protein